VYRRTLDEKKNELKKTHDVTQMQNIGFSNSATFYDSLFAFFTVSTPGWYKMALLLGLQLEVDGADHFLFFLPVKGSCWDTLETRPCACSAAEATLTSS